VITRVLSS